MTVTIKHVSEYKRQFKWHDVPPAEPMAGCPSFKVKKVAEPALQANQRPTLELASKEEFPEVIKTFGSPSKDLQISREPSFVHKKRVPGASPERIKVDKSLAKKAGLTRHVNSARYQSEYASKFSPKKGSLPLPSSPVQTAKLNFGDSKTNLPIGKRPVEKKVQSEYVARFADPTTELQHIRELYKEQVRRKQLQLEKIEKVTAAIEKEPEKSEPANIDSKPVPDIKPAVTAVTKEPGRKIKLKIVSPLRGDNPKVKATYDIISPQKPSKVYWKSEYKSKFQSPAKDAAPSASSAYGRRNHPYKPMTPDRVSDLITPDKSDVAINTPTNSLSWFSEVLELRKLARKFKARSHGSHFSPHKLVQLAYSDARLRDSQPVVTPTGSTESVTIIPTAKPVSAVHIEDPPPQTETLKPENDLVVTDLEECPNIDNLVIKTNSLSDVHLDKPEPLKPLPKPVKKPKSLDSSSSIDAPKAVAAKAESECSTPRTADRSFSLFGDRVPTPKLKNQGSRHHFDRTTFKNKTQKIRREPALKTVIMAGRVATPTLQEKGGSRHHLDCTTPAAKVKENGLTEGTQPFSPILSDTVQEKLDFSTPSKRKADCANKKNDWTKDLDTSVLSRASSCTSLASATLTKARQRGTDFWK